MNTSRVVQVIPTNDDEYVLFVSQKKQVKCDRIKCWAVIEKLNYDTKWERMSLVIRPVVVDGALGFKMLDDDHIVRSGISGSQKKCYIKRQYAEEIKSVIANLKNKEEQNDE